MSSKTPEDPDRGPEPSDMGADAGLELPDTGQKVYYCRHCGMSFGDPLSMGRHIRQDHRQDRQPTGENRDGGGPSSEDPRDLESRDLQKQVKLLELRRQELEKQARILRLDPGYGRASGPLEDPDLAFLTSLRKKDLIEAEVEKIRAQTEAYRQPQFLPAPQDNDEVKELREELRALQKQVDDKRFDDLKSSMENAITGLRSELNSNQSELKTMIVEAADLAKTWISNPGPIMQIGASRLGFEAVPVPTSEAPEGARDDIIEGLRKHGFTARIIEREKP